MSFSVIQTIMGMIGSVGFAVLFGVRGRKLAVIALGSGAGWAVYLVCRAMGCSIFTGLLAASLFVAALSEVLARMLRTPVILLLVPMLIPEVPGEALYYTMYYLVQGYQEEFGTYSGLVLTEAGAIALGIILASHMARFFISLKSHLRSREIKKENRTGGFRIYEIRICVTQWKCRGTGSRSWIRGDEDKGWYGNHGSGLHSFYLYGWQRRCAACCDSVLKRESFLFKGRDRIRKYAASR